MLCPASGPPLVREVVHMVRDLEVGEYKTLKEAHDLIVSLLALL